MSGEPSHQSDAPGCRLCELPVPDPPVTGTDIDGRFCCRGCLEIHRALGDIDPDQAPKRVRSRIRERRSAPEPIDTAVDSATTYLTIDGMHCSTCELFLEDRTLALDGVHDARASYASDVLRVDHDPERVDHDRLVDAVSGTGYRASPRQPGSASADPAPDVTITRFLIGGGFFGMMVMLWYVLFLYPTYFGYAPIIDLSGTAGLYLFLQIWLMTSIVLLYTGFPLLRGAYVSLRARQPNMDLLVSIAACSAYLYSTVAMAIGRTDLYFDVTVAIILVVTAGTVYEGRVKERATGLVSDLTSMRVTAARIADGGHVPVEALKPGDAVLVRPGERIPVDGVVRDGAAAVDEALVTGESVPRTRRAGDAVRGGTVVMDHPLTVAVTAPVESTVERLVDLQWSIQSARHGVQRLVDKLSTVFVPIVLVLAVGGALGTLLVGGSPVTAMLVGLTVLIVSCPCALGVATPLAIAAGVKAAAARGVVIASDAFFEAAPSVDIVAIDKTGTLTRGEMTVEAIHGDDPDAVLRLAAAVERFSPHPVAESICRAAIDRTESIRTDGGPLTVPQGQEGTDRAVGPDADAASVRTFDRGIQGTVSDQTVTVGHPAMFHDRGWSIPREIGHHVESIRSSGSIPVLVGVDDEIAGVIAVGDRPRPDWESMIAELDAGGHEVVILTGDDSGAAERFRESPHVDSVFAGVPPAAKAETIERLRATGSVAMIGDGSNDAPALAAADIGIALDSGTELAVDAADAIVVTDDLHAAVDVFRLAAGTNRRIKQNLGWALVYNLIAIPLALTGLLNPLFAAVAMATSSALVVLNSAREVS